MSGAAPYRPVSAGITRTILDADKCSFKRLAWAYGCAPKGSEEEIQLEMLLLQRAASEANEIAATWASIAVENGERIGEIEHDLQALRDVRGI